MLFLSYLELATTMNDDLLVTCIIGGALKMEVAMIISFEHRPFNAVFGIFFIKEILTHFGTQPLNNFGVETPYFSLSDGKFTNNFEWLDCILPCPINYSLPGVTGSHIHLNTF